MNQNKSYQIMQADQEQREFIFSNRYRVEKEHDDYTVIAAVRDDCEIIGHIIARAKEDAPESWFIWHIRVDDDYRRLGIGTALFGELHRLALEKGVKDLGGFSNPTVEASMFWESLGFCHSKMGRIKMEGDWNINGFGNYSHIIFRSPEERVYQLPEISVPVRVERTSRGKVDFICEKYLFPKNQKLFEQYKDNLFGFAAVDDTEQIVGFVLMKYEMMYAPLKDIMMLGWIYVEPEMRRRGIGSELLFEAVSFAKDSGMKQILFGGKDDDLPFWEKQNFYVHKWGKSKDAPEKYAILAGLKL